MTTLNTRLLLLTSTFVKRLIGVCSLCAVTFAAAQTSTVAAPMPDPLAMAQSAIARQDWAKAEAILLPISEAQPRNPFVFYEMARVYENTNRVDSARQIYQGLANIPDAQQRQYAVVVRTPEVSYLTSLVSLSQARLNALNASTPAVGAALAARVAPMPVAVSVAPIPAPVAPTSAASVARQSSVNTAVSTTLQGWANAWANKDVPGYFSHYVSGYKGAFRSAAAWQKQRNEYIKSKKTISLDITDVQVTQISDAKAQAHFKQAYTSDSYTDTTSKTLVLAKSGDRWLIERETTK